MNLLLRPLCWLGVHVWQPMKWGRRGDLDCRACLRCGRFEVWTYWNSFEKRDRTVFPDAKA